MAHGSGSRSGEKEEKSVGCVAEIYYLLEVLHTAVAADVGGVGRRKWVWWRYICFTDYLLF